MPPNEPRSLGNSRLEQQLELLLDRIPRGQWQALEAWLQRVPDAWWNRYDLAIDRLFAAPGRLLTLGLNVARRAMEVSSDRRSPSAAIPHDASDSTVWKELSALLAQLPAELRAPLAQTLVGLDPMMASRLRELLGRPARGTGQPPAAHPAPARPSPVGAWKDFALADFGSVLPLNAILNAASRRPDPVLLETRQPASAELAGQLMGQPMLWNPSRATVPGLHDQERWTPAPAFEPEYVQRVATLDYRRGYSFAWKLAESLEDIRRPYLLRLDLARISPHHSRTVEEMLEVLEMPDRKPLLERPIWPAEPVDDVLAPCGLHGQAMVSDFLDEVPDRSAPFVGDAEVDEEPAWEAEHT